MKDNETNEVIEHIKKQDGIEEIVLDNEIKQNHTEANPLYESMLDNIAKEIDEAIKTLESSISHDSDFMVFATVRKLQRLYDKITKEV